MTASLRSDRRRSWQCRWPARRALLEQPRWHQQVGLPGPPAGLAVGSIDFDHVEPPAPQVASEASAIGTSALDTDAFHLAETDEPVVQLGKPGGGRRERLDRQHTAVDIHHGGDMSIQVGVDTTGDRTRRFYDGHGHPFSLQVVKGWHARPGKETVSSTLRLTASSITLRNGACLVSAPRPGRQAPNEPQCDNPSQTRPQEPPTVTTTSVELVDPPINRTTRVSLAVMSLLCWIRGSSSGETGWV